MAYRPADYTQEQKQLKRKYPLLRTSQIARLIQQRRHRNSLIRAIGLIIASASFLFAHTAHGDPKTVKSTEAVYAPALWLESEKPSLPTIPEKTTTTGPNGRRNEYKPLSDSIAKAHNVDPEWMWRIVLCESGGNPNADNPTSTATGLVQILLSAHPNITKEQALDPVFSLEYLATNLAAGRASMWVCK